MIASWFSTGDTGANDKNRNQSCVGSEGSKFEGSRFWFKVCIEIYSFIIVEYYLLNHLALSLSPCHCPEPRLREEHEEETT